MSQTPLECPNCNDGQLTESKLTRQTWETASRNVPAHRRRTLRANEDIWQCESGCGCMFGVSPDGEARPLNSIATTFVNALRRRGVIHDARDAEHYWRHNYEGSGVSWGDFRSAFRRSVAPSHRQARPVEKERDDINRLFS